MNLTKTGFEILLATCLSDEWKPMKKLEYRLLIRQH